MRPAELGAAPLPCFECKQMTLARTGPRMWRCGHRWWSEMYSTPAGELAAREYRCRFACTDQFFIDHGRLTGWAVALIGVGLVTEAELRAAVSEPFVEVK